MIVMVEVAVHAALVAAVGDVQVHTDGDPQRQGFLIHLRQQSHSSSGGGAEDGLRIGCSDTRRMPCCQSLSTNCTASRVATPGSISNSSQILPATISDNGVRPSAACHIAVATSFKVKKVESAADMIIISLPNMRAAIAELRAMYFSLIRTLRTTYLIRSQTRSSGTNVNRLTGTRSTNSQAD